MGIKNAILYFYLTIHASKVIAIQDATFSCHNNVAIDDSEVSFNTTSELQLLCAHECLQHEQCRHFDYNNITKDCHLGFAQYRQKTVSRVNTKFCTTAMSAVVPGPGETTVIICNWDILPIISCDNGHINILYANFGRTKPASEVYCEYDGNQLDDTNCYQHSYPPRVMAACDGQTSCQIVRNPADDGDPCHGTTKYYHVTYVCEI